MAVAGSHVEQGATAVVADRLPLVRVGLVASLGVVGVRTVALADGLGDAVEAARHNGAALLVLGGDVAAEALAAQLGRLGATRVVVMVARADRRLLAALFESGADAVALRSISPEDFGALVRRVLEGERSIDPALMSVLLELARDSAVPAGPDPSRRGADAPITVPAPAARLNKGLPVDGVPLTSKERMVLDRLAEGESNAEIAAALYVSTATVKTHLSHIYAKLGVGSRHGATTRAASLGLLPPAGD